MARSKTGGSRALLRGRIASEVYSIGRDAKGVRQQVVRSRPESVANPRTQLQVNQRIRMKTAGLALAQMAPIVNHSFEGVPYGTPANSKFMQLATSKMKSLIDGGTPNVGFEYAAPDETVMQAGYYPLSRGSVIIPSNFAFTADTPKDSMGDVYPMVQIGLPAVASGQTMTVGKVLDAMGLAEGDYITLCVLIPLEGDEYGCDFKFARFYVKAGLDRTQVLSIGNSVKFVDLSSLFDTEGNIGVLITGFSGTTGAWSETEGKNFLCLCADYATVTPDIAGGFILSRNQGGKWLRSNADIQGPASVPTYDIVQEYAGYDWTEAVAEWPVGTQRFLNGGDI